MIAPPAPARWRLAYHGKDFALYAGALGLSVLLGASLVADGRLAKLVIVASGLVLALAIPPEKLFAGWIFCAPLVQGASDGGHSGHVVYTVLFLVPPLILAGRALTGAMELRDLWVIDALPALYIAWILVSLHVVGSELTGNSSSLRAVYAAVGISIFAYYFTAFAKASDGFESAIIKALLWSGVVVAAFAVIEAATSWNVWGNDVGGGITLRRVVSTMTSPGALGAYLGAGLAFAVAILVWNGPRTLKLPSTLLIGLSVPALYFTYTRGPIMAVAIATVFMVLIGKRARWPSVLLAATVAILVFATWGQISGSGVYKERLGVTSTADTRLALQEVSLDLFRERPVFGWGYDTFDQAKLTVPTRERDIVDLETSHNTVLTILVELGIFGVALLVLPWVVIAVRALAAARRGSAEPWIAAGAVGAATVCFIGALTYDSRFFAIITALPWISLGLARANLRKTRASAESTVS